MPTLYRMLSKVPSSNINLFLGLGLRNLGNKASFRERQQFFNQFERACSVRWNLSNEQFATKNKFYSQP